MKGCITKKNGRYYTIISLKDPGSGKWKRKGLGGYRTKKEAQKTLTEAVSQVNKGWFQMPSRETVAEVCDNYLTNVAPNRVRANVLDSYGSNIRLHVTPRIGSKPAVCLTADDLNGVMTEMRLAGKSVTTVRYVLRVVHIILQDAVRKGKLIRNVADLADPPPAHRYEPQVWIGTELDQFLTEAAKPEYSGYYELYATEALTGVRRGENLGIKWEDVDLNSDSPKVFIRRSVDKFKGKWQIKPPKTPRSRREIGLPMSLMLLLRQLRERQEANAEWAGRKLSPEDYIFARPDGTLPDPTFVSKLFSRMVRNAGLKHIRLHDLRHTFTTLLRKKGVPIEVISKILGHANPTITLNMYDHYEGELRATADAIDEILGAKPQKKEQGAFVRKSLEEGKGTDSEPCRDRTCDHLIKSHSV